MKNRILELKSILERESDEQHPLRTTELLQALAQAGVQTERKTVYRCIEILRDSGLDILETRSPAHGYYLASRHFEEVEVRLLIDAVLAASFITQKKTDLLVKKLEEMVSVYQARRLHSQVFIDNRVKAANEYIYYAIDHINDAIEQKKRISLLYTRGRRVRTFEISPYAMAWNKDKFYVIGNIEKYDNLLHLRLDRISDVKILAKAARPFEEVCEYRNYFDSADYVARHINMFGGEPERIVLWCSERGLDLLTDQFGADMAVTPQEDGYLVRIKAAAGQGMVGFLAQCGREIRVEAPQRLAESLQEHARALLALYA